MNEEQRLRDLLWRLRDKHSRTTLDVRLRHLLERRILECERRIDRLPRVEKAN